MERTAFRGGSLIRLDGGVVRVRGENKKKEWHVRRMPAADKESSGIARGIPGVFDHRNHIHTKLHVPFVQYFRVISRALMQCIQS